MSYLFYWHIFVGRQIAILPPAIKKLKIYFAVLIKNRIFNAL